MERYYIKLRALKCPRVRIHFVSRAAVVHGHSLCVAFFAISRDIHTIAVYVAVLMEPTSAEVCELSKLGALLKWVGVPEVNAPAIRKGVVLDVWCQRDRRCISHRSTSARLDVRQWLPVCEIAKLAEAKHQPLHVFASMVVDGVGSCTTG